MQNLVCWLGRHRDIVNEDRTVQRRTTEDGFHEDIVAIMECRCGVVIKSESHTHTSTGRQVFESRSAAPLPDSWVEIQDR